MMLRDMTLLTRRGSLAWAVLLISLLLVFMAWSAMREQNMRNARQQFELLSREITEAITKRLHNQEQILLGGAGLFDASNAVSRAEWRAYVERLQLKRNYPGVLGVGYSHVIQPEALAAHIATVRAEGFPDYTVKPPGERPLYTSILYLEPFSGRNLAAFGYDMFSQETRHKAMQAAVDNNATTISAKVKLVQETHGKEQAGFLMYVPVYHPGLPLGTPADRWSALKGFVYSPYRVDDLMQGILGERNLVIDFTIHDGSNVSENTLMYTSTDWRTGIDQGKPRHTAVGHINAFGHTWTVSMFSRPSFEAGFASTLDWLLPVLGIGISFSLFALTWSLLSRREKAISLARDMTSELNQFKNTLDRTLDCVFMFDAASLRFFYANEGALRQIGYSREEILMMHPYDIKPDISMEQFHELIAPLIAGEKETLTFETVHQSKAGQRIPVEIFLQYIAPTDEPARFVAIVRDITERRAVEQERHESEQRFRYMLETCPTAARIAKAGGHDVIFSNRRYAELINTAPGETSGIDPSTYYAHPEDYADILLRLGKGEQIFDRLVELVIPGVGNKWALASYLPIQYRGDTAVLGWFYDITDRKQAETTLREQSLHTQAILDHMVDGLITIDERGIIGSFNPAAEHIFGYTPEEVLGHNVKMLMPNPHRDAHDNYLRNYQATGVARIIGIGREVEGQRKDGSLFPMDLAISEITRQGRPLYVGMVRDITERKRMERMKSEFVSTVSHELRTPLTSISGALGLMAGGALGELPEQARHLISIAHKNSQRLTHLINDLLDMEKIAAGKLHFEMQPQALMPLLEQALEANRAYSTERGVALTLTGAAPAAEVRVDSQRMMQVLANLLSNAIKFSPENGTVEISAQATADKVRVAVTDHGPGIPKAFRARIFQKFSQADSSDTRQKGGTGLGLAITRELVEHMGGQIGFESVEGEGASFFFELPLWHAAATGAAAAPPTMENGAPRLLVVEDEPDVAQLLGLMLTRAGYQVDIAGTGAEALRALQQRPYAAVSLDLMLPDVSGLEIVRQIRQRPETADLPIVVVSAKMEEGRLAINGDFSGIDWLAKPVDETRLLAALEKLVSAGSGAHPRVLHIEDDADLHEVIRAMIGGRFDFELATTLQEARARIVLERFDVVILDLTLPDGSGWDLLPEIRTRQPDARVVILSGTNVTMEETRKVEAVLLKSQVSPRELLDAINIRIQPRKSEGDHP